LPDALPTSASSTTRSRIPGNEESSAFNMPARSDASRTTSSSPAVYERRAGGIRTRTPIRAISPADARDMTPPPEHGIHGETKRFWSAGVSQRGAESEGLSRVSPSAPLMVSVEILKVALRLATQSETSADPSFDVPARDVRRTLLA